MAWFSDLCNYLKFLLAILFVSKFSRVCTVESIMKLLELRDTLSEWFNVCLSFSLGKGTPLIF